MIPLAIILIILNILAVVILPNPKFDWANYIAVGMLIAAIILAVMKG